MWLLSPEEQQIHMPMRMVAFPECRIRRLQCHPLWRQLYSVNLLYRSRKLPDPADEGALQKWSVFYRSSKTVMVLRKTGQSLYLEKSSTRKLPSRRTNPVAIGSVPSGYALMQGQTFDKSAYPTCSRFIRQA